MPMQQGDSAPSLWGIPEIEVWTPPSALASCLSAMPLRQYQGEALAKSGAILTESLRKNGVGRSLLVLFCGLGKTRVFVARLLADAVGEQALSLSSSGGVSSNLVQDRKRLGLLSFSSQDFCAKTSAVVFPTLSLVRGFLDKYVAEFLASVYDVAVFCSEAPDGRTDGDYTFITSSSPGQAAVGANGRGRGRGRGRRKAKPLLKDLEIDILSSSEGEEETDAGHRGRTVHAQYATWKNRPDRAKPRLVVTTYDSYEKFLECVAESGDKIARGIFDEAHNLTKNRAETVFGESARRVAKGWPDQPQQQDAAASENFAGHHDQGTLAGGLSYAGPPRKRVHILPQMMEFYTATAHNSGRIPMLAATAATPAGADGNSANPRGAKTSELEVDPAEFFGEKACEITAADGIKWKVLKGLRPLVRMDETQVCHDPAGVKGDAVSVSNAEGEDVLVADFVAETVAAMYGSSLIGAYAASLIGGAALQRQAGEESALGTALAPPFGAPLDPESAAGAGGGGRGAAAVKADGEAERQPRQAATEGVARCKKEETLQKVLALITAKDDNGEALEKAAAAWYGGPADFGFCSREKQERLAGYFKTIAEACFEHSEEHGHCWNVVAFHSRATKTAEPRASSCISVEDFSSDGARALCLRVFRKVLRKKFPHLRDVYNNFAGGLGGGGAAGHSHDAYSSLHLRGIYSSAKDKAQNAKTRKESIALLDERKPGRVCILSTCEMLKEGVDTAQANMAVFVDLEAKNPTDPATVARMLQKLGRVMRADPSDLVDPVQDEHPRAILLLPIIYRKPPGTKSDTSGGATSAASSDLKRLCQGPGGILQIAQSCLGYLAPGCRKNVRDRILGRLQDDPERGRYEAMLKDFAPKMKALQQEQPQAQLQFQSTDELDMEAAGHGHALRPHPLDNVSESPPGLELVAAGAGGEENERRAGRNFLSAGPGPGPAGDASDALDGAAESLQPDAKSMEASTSSSSPALLAAGESTKSTDSKMKSVRLHPSDSNYPSAPVLDVAARYEQESRRRRQQLRHFYHDDPTFELVLNVLPPDDCSRFAELTCDIADENTAWPQKYAQAKAFRAAVASSASSSVRQKLKQEKEKDIRRRLPADLFRWECRQLTQQKAGKLSGDRIEKLNKLPGWSWDPSEPREKRTRAAPADQPTMILDDEDEAEDKKSGHSSGDHHRRSPPPGKEVANARQDGRGSMQVQTLHQPAPGLSSVMVVDEEDDLLADESAPGDSLLDRAKKQRRVALDLPAPPGPESRPQQVKVREEIKQEAREIEMNRTRSGDLSDHSEEVEIIGIVEVGGQTSQASAASSSSSMPLRQAQAQAGAPADDETNFRRAMENERREREEKAKNLMESCGVTQGEAEQALHKTGWVCERAAAELLLSDADCDGEISEPSSFGEISEPSSFG